MRLSDLEQEELDKYLSRYDFSAYIKDKTFLITGSKGIVGSGVIKWLLYENTIHGTNTRIIASSRTTEIPDWIDGTDNIQFCEFGEELSACDAFNIDYIIHAAAPTSGKTFVMQPVESLMVILDGTRRMLDLAHKHKSTMIYLSSEEAYGLPETGNPIAEDYVGAVDSLNIRSCFPLGKKTAELMCRSYYEEYGVDVKIIRPTVFLGLWQAYDSVKVEAEILRCILENKNLIMKTDGSTEKSVIYSMDALAAVFTVLFKGNAGEAYNATNSATYTSVRSRAESMFAVFNPNSNVEFEVQKFSGESKNYLPKRKLRECTTKLELLGWQAYADMREIYRIDMQRFSKVK